MPLSPETLALTSAYQPIVSVNRGRVVGYEALARPRNHLSGEPLSLAALFKEAEESGTTLELDRLCRQSAVEGFCRSEAWASELLVFINLDVSILNSRTVGSNRIASLVSGAGLSPERVVIEILESRVEDDEAMHRFIENHRAQGFLIALDDMGTGHSNLERIPSMRPDLIKLDRSLISGIDRDYRKQELFDCFARLTTRIGGLIIAEGVETEAEASACLERGADLMQGYLFARPGEISCQRLKETEEKTAGMREAYRNHRERRRLERMQKEMRYRELSETLARRLTAAGPGEEELEKLAASCPDLECLYLLDGQGVQISPTVFNPACRERPHSPLYSPARAGCDQSGREYSRALKRGDRFHVTEPYISRATGTICVTVSAPTPDRSGGELILCIDLPANLDQ